MGELKFYIVEFDEFSIMKPNVYLPNCVIGGDNWQAIIILIYNEYTFLINNGIRKI